MDFLVDLFFEFTRFFWRNLLLATAFVLGRVILLACTLGRYPRGTDLDRHRDRIMLVGVLTLLGLIAVVVIARLH